MMNTLDGKIALITGGGRGLGEAISRELASAGSVVIPADIRIDLAKKVAGDLLSLGCQAMPLEINLTDEDQIKEAVQMVVDRFGRIDILVNNAGTDKTQSVEDLGIADWDNVMAVNLRAPFILSKYIFPIMRANGGGQIVNITSTAAKRAWANAAAYHSSKWGLLGFSHALHVEGRPHHIKVTAVIAGGMRTPFLLDRFPDIDTGNLQDPKNVAETVRFLLCTPEETVIPEVMVIPMRETSWP
jgi:NAD(P)-dependent dehydrogenase (short-subunit alcohol dehydrogenase family)